MNESRKSLCRFGNVYRNRDLVGGLGAGNFTDKGKVKSIEDCMQMCCGMEECSVAYMVEHNCFAISCKDKEQCKTFSKSPSENSPVLGIVQRLKPGESEQLQQPLKPTQKPTPSSGTSGNPDEKASFFSWEDESDPPSNLFDLLTTKAPSHTPSTPTADSKPAAPSCTNSKLYRHVSLKGGLRSGNFTRLAQHSDMAECADKCCAQPGCDVAILMRTSCFGLRCASVELCGTRPARLRNFSLKIMYIHRENHEVHTKPTTAIEASEPSLEELLGEIKPTQSPTTGPPLNNMLGVTRMVSNFATTGKPRPDCSQGLSINNVILNGGMGAGEIAQFPHVSDIQLCIEKCCLSTKCHVASVIQGVCYTVNCFSRDLCRTRPIENTAVKSTISYIKRAGDAMFSSAEEASVKALVRPTTLPTTRSSATAKPSEKPDVGTICQRDKTLYNVKLQGGQKSGVFTDRGSVLESGQCVQKCCGDPSCDLAYTVGQQCYTVQCYNRKLCQRVVASPLALNAAIAYVVRLTSRSGVKVLGDNDVRPTTSSKPSLTAAARPTEQTPTSLETTKRTRPTMHHGRKATERKKVTHLHGHHRKLEPTYSPRPYREFKHHLQKHRHHRHHHHHHHHHHEDPQTCSPEQYGCQHKCVNLPNGGHRCLCHSGYRLAPNGRHCQDADECEDNTLGCEHQCVKNDGSFRCECHNGFMLNHDLQHCDDLDECLLGVDGCLQVCHNTPGSYKCSCKEGYQLGVDKVSCEASTEVGTKKDQDHPSVTGLEIPSMIIQTPKDLNITQGLSGTFHCKARGHPAPRIAWASGRNGDLPIPSDDRYKILPSGSLIVIRVNMSDAGLYRCIASNPAGSSTAVAKLRVEDFDECSSHSHGCQQLCINTLGSYRCECHSGFMLERNRRKCQDVDECTVESHICDHVCRNAPGSFTCHCKPGYLLSPDLRGCLDIDECSEPGHGCTQLCNNTKGSYNCMCLKGYQLINDNRTCVDRYVTLDSQKPVTLSAGMGAFVAVAAVSGLIVIGTVLCVLQYRRRAHLSGSDDADKDDRKSLYSWLE